MSLLPQPAVVDAAVILRVWPTGETSVVASLLSRTHGYVRVIAKGARGQRSTLRPLVQPGRLAEVEFGMREGRELQYLRGGRLLLDPLLDSNSLERTAFLLGAVELVDRCRPGGGPEPALFAHCRGYLEMLSSCGQGGEAPLFYAFELGLLELQGVAPALDRCSACGRGVGGGGGLRFAAAGGGVVCRSCRDAGEGRGGRPLDAAVLEALRGLADAASPPPLTRRVAREVGILLHEFLGHHLPQYRLPAALDLLRTARGDTGPANAGDERGRLR